MHGWSSGRQARSISYRIGGAKFPVLKDLDTFVFADTPIDEGQLRELATAPSPTPSAMRSLSAHGNRQNPSLHVRTLARGRFFNLVDLVNQLDPSKACSGLRGHRSVRARPMGSIVRSAAVAGTGPKTLTLIHVFEELRGSR